MWSAQPFQLICDEFSFFPPQNCSTQECVSHVISLFPLRLQHCSSDGPEGPSGFLERLCFEMKKGYKETMLQLLLSPIHIFISDNYQVRKRSADRRRVPALPSVFAREMMLRFFTLNSLLNITQEKTRDNFAPECHRMMAGLFGFKG